MTHSAIASCATFLLLPHFNVICDLLLNRRNGNMESICEIHSRPVQNSEWFLPETGPDQVYYSRSFLCECLFTLNRDAAVVRMGASHQCGPSSIPAPSHMWVEFAVGSRLALRVLSRFIGFPPSSITNTQRSNSNRIKDLHEYQLEKMWHPL